jgi:hypothetical protein
MTSQEVAKLPHDELTLARFRQEVNRSHVNARAFTLEYVANEFMAAIERLRLVVMPSLDLC